MGHWRLTPSLSTLSTLSTSVDKVDSVDMSLERCCADKTLPVKGQFGMKNRLHFGFFTLTACLFTTAQAVQAQSPEQILRAQQMLNDLGFDAGPADGIWGGKTSAALQSFYQNSTTREFDGELSRNELEHLAEALGVVLPGLVGEFSSTPATISTDIFVPDARVVSRYDGYERFVNGEFQFPSLRLIEEDFTHGTLIGDNKTDSSGYYFNTMVQFADYGDLDGDGDNDVAMVGWRADGENQPARLHYVYFENGQPHSTEQMPLEGSAAIWLRDFDVDGVSEALVVGFLDFPVNPAPSYYIDGTLSDAVTVGPLIDSHESNVVDYDDDGDLDVVAITYGKVNETFSVFVNDGGSFQHQYVETDFNISGSSIEFGDFDGDGVGEFIVGDASYPRNDAGIWRYSFVRAENPFRLTSSSQDLVAPQYFSTPEFNGIRSHWDINYPSANSRWLEGMRSHDLVLEAVDIDLDGDLDLVNSSLLWSEVTSMGIVQILVNDGQGNFSDETADRLFGFQRSGEAAHTVNVLDVNGDEFPDIILSDRELWDGAINSQGLSHDLSVITSGNKLLINDGDGHFVEAHRSIFSEFTVLEGWANSWFPVYNADGTLTFISLFRTPDGQRDLWQFAKLNRPLSTGPNFTNPADYGVPEFNEFYVLRTNQEARDAVLSGEYDSALDWFLNGRETIKINSRAEPMSCLQFTCAQ